MRFKSLASHLFIIFVLGLLPLRAVAQDAQPGDWIHAEYAPVMLQGGESYQQFTLLPDGTGLYAGEEIFPPGEQMNAYTLLVFPSPDETMSLVFHHNTIGGGERVVLVDHVNGVTVPHEVTPERLVGLRRSFPIVSWSPDGRLVAFPVGERRFEGQLVILAHTGEHVIHSPDELGVNNTAFVQIDSLRTGGPDWVSVLYEILNCRPGCAAPARTGSVDAGHRLMFSPAVWAEREVTAPVEASPPIVAPPATDVSPSPSSDPLMSPGSGFVMNVQSREAIAAQSIVLNEGRAALVRDLLDAYDSDIERIRMVAANADYALMAWAAYTGSEPAVDLLASRGWSPWQNLVIENGVAGDTVAQIFVSDEGRHVLAFRGTQDMVGDNVTNFAGTAGMVREQIVSGAELAVDIATRYPSVTFVGHSLGGRLSQVARLTTGRPAVIFNSAGLGIGDRSIVESNRLERGLPLIDTTTVPLLPFSGPDDRLSSAFIYNNIEVSNIVTPEYAGMIEGLNILRSSAIFMNNQIEFSHRIDVLATAMLVVQAVVDEGWLDAYLAQDAAASTRQNTAQQKAGGERADTWGPDIVYSGAQDVFSVCGYDATETALRGCLPGIGMTERGIDFLLRFSRNVVAREYIELGTVDLVHAEADRGARTIVLVNGNPDSLEVRTHYDDAQDLFLDGASQFLLNRHPGFYGGGGGITRFTGHRILPGGGQRFVFMTPLQDGCRACPAIGQAIVYYDFDRQGNFLESRPIGIWGPSLFSLPEDATFDVGRSSIPLLQLRLNELGYDAGGMDGVMGERTRLAIRSFKADKCMWISEDVDEITIVRLARTSHISSGC